MARFGSGRHGRHANREQDFRRVDLASFNHAKTMRTGFVGKITWSRGEVETASIGYTIHQGYIGFRWTSRAGTPQGREAKVYFDYTAQPLGGHRRWFLCPHCHTRCRVLYLSADLACRKCWRMVYDCQYESIASSLFNRNDRNRLKLGGDAGLANCFPSKPKNMHWQTYYKLRDYDWHAVNCFEAVLNPNRFG